MLLHHSLNGLSNHFCFFCGSREAKYGTKKHRLNPYSHVQVVGGAYIPPVAPSGWSHQQLRYYRITGENAIQSVFSTVEIRHSREDSTWAHNFGCSLGCIENIINYLKGDPLEKQTCNFTRGLCVVPQMVEVEPELSIAR